MSPWLVDGLTEAERARLDRTFREEHRHELDDELDQVDDEERDEPEGGDDA